MHDVPFQFMTEFYISPHKYTNIHISYDYSLIIFFLDWIAQYLKNNNTLLWSIQIEQKIYTNIVGCIAIKEMGTDLFENVCGFFLLWKKMKTEILFDNSLWRVSFPRIIKIFPWKVHPKEIAHFFFQKNLIFKSVWTYILRIHPCVTVSHLCKGLNSLMVPLLRITFSMHIFYVWSWISTQHHINVMKFYWNNVRTLTKAKTFAKTPTFERVAMVSINVYLPLQTLWLLRGCFDDVTEHKLFFFLSYV